MAEDMRTKTDEYWREKLTPDQFRIVREKGTEAPGTGEYLDNHEAGAYNCVACGTELFSSETKFESGSGWPSFYDVAKAGTVELHEDKSYGMVRTEAICTHCGAHLGHVFNDGPKETTGQRYCINSVSLKFAPKNQI